MIVAGSPTPGGPPQRRHRRLVHPGLPSRSGGMLSRTGAVRWRGAGPNRADRGRRASHRLRAGGRGTAAHPSARVRRRQAGNVARPARGLSDEFTVVAWDAPGVGRSSDPPPEFRLPDYADCLAGFVAALGFERPHVAGLSFGGGLALELDRRHPSVPRTLVLASAYAGGQAPCRTRRSTRVCSRPWTWPTCRQIDRADHADALLGTTPAETWPSSRSTRRFHPAGLRAMAQSIAEAKLRDVLPGSACRARAPR